MNDPKEVHQSFYSAGSFAFYEEIIKPQSRTLTSSFSFTALCRQCSINNKDNTAQLIKIDFTTQRAFGNQGLSHNLSDIL